MFTTADLWDEHETLLSCVDPIFNHFGNKKMFSGKITTIKLFEDNSLVRKQLESDGKDKVLVIDGGASLRCALIGDQLAALAIQNNWEGIIVNGCIRDSYVINPMNIGIKALNTSPVKSVKRNLGEINIPVKFGGITFIPEDYIYADGDGILVSKNNLLK
ncbi:ribonuclease E activity regulator RraA [Flavobacterium frigoris]|uniref:4-hydroxy-4-methyl-2-oxoglutarate aldolase n=1 Tax=Flavobacterium frigoris (strain PS1) TaxID=1086011 RepID=H7FVF5_FLAFP|nr:ribonuclease E activity regulator RraA [Flavobacterium frigoris]EIA07488.1 ribonuclease E inhibitor RraA [Flavobacterium frigoris PS1]